MKRVFFFYDHTLTKRKTRVLKQQINSFDKSGYWLSRTTIFFFFFFKKTLFEKLQYLKQEQ